MALLAWAKFIPSKRCPGYACSKSLRYSGIWRSRTMRASQIWPCSVSLIAASSLPWNARISSRESTGNIGSIEMVPNSNTGIMADVIAETGRGVEGAGIVLEDPTVPEHRLVLVEIEQRRCISRDKESLGVNPRSSQAGCSLADGEATEIARAERRKMTGHARDVAVPAQDLVERKCLAQLDERRSDDRWTGSRGVIPRPAVSWRTSAARALMPAFDISGALGGAVASSLQPDRTIREVQAASVPMAAWILMPHLPFGWLSGGTTGGVRLDKAPRLNLARRSATGQERLRQEGIGARLPGSSWHSPAGCRITRCGPALPVYWRMLKVCCRPICVSKPAPARGPNCWCCRCSPLSRSCRTCWDS